MPSLLHPFDGQDKALRWQRQRAGWNRVIVTPAKAGVHPAGITPPDEWIPAFAGMTMRKGTDYPP
jgi:hypothetical protein